MTTQQHTQTIHNLEEQTIKADPKILNLFPSLNKANTAKNINEKITVLWRLAFIQTIGNKGKVTSADLRNELKASRHRTTKTLTELSSLSLIKAEQNGKTCRYTLTTSGVVALVAFEEYQDWTKIKSALMMPQRKNDPLAYALLVVGFCEKKPDSIQQLLHSFATQGNIIENIPTDIAAESILLFHRQKLQLSSPIPPTYLSVFKEFTTKGFQEVFQMLLTAIKPTAEDYNWLIEFFSEVAEFYFDPARVAYVNLLQENQKLQTNLETFKKAQDQQIKKQDGNLEVTFTIPGAGMSKIDSMPPHLRAVGMRLILEPAKFINKELANYFWNN
jgi:DNA-binding MarR family transcriptional regulator